MDQETKRWHAEQAALYLERVKGMAAMVKALNYSIRELEAVADGVKAMDYSRDIVQVSPTDDTMPNNVCKLIALKAEREERRAEYERELEAVTMSLARMKDRTRAAILEMHYIGGATWRECGEVYSYTKRGMMHVRQSALSDFFDVMPPSQLFKVPPAI